MPDDEANRFSARAARYVRVGTNVGSVAARIAGNRLLGREPDRDRYAADLAAALGGLKGPIMKAAQLLSTIPEALPPEYSRELSQLQSQAPPMGPAFVRRRMQAELGPDWAARFKSFEAASSASASLGQVHKAVTHDGRLLAVKLQYPDMQSAVAADLSQLRMLFALHARMDPAVETADILLEISDRLREELDYGLEACHMRLYGLIFRNDPIIRVPDVVPELSTGRLLSMSWLEGRRLIDYKTAPLEDRNQIARAMFRAWWYPFSHFGVIHGDPHLGNYNVFESADAGWASEAPRNSADAGSATEPPRNCADAGSASEAQLASGQPKGHAGPAAGGQPKGHARGINLLDYGCMRTFHPKFVQGVIDLYRGLERGDGALIVHAYETWGFRGLSKELIDVLNIWARFIYGPLLDDRVRSIAEGTTPGEYGRKEAFTVHEALRKKGPVKVPREFVFMDRAAIGLGGVFLHLDAHLNYYRIFNETIEGFVLAEVAERQRQAFAATGVPLPA